MNNTFGERLRALREEDGISQRELARRLHCNNQLISRFEHGVVEPHADILRELCRYFVVSADYLLGLSDLRNPAADRLAPCIEEAFGKLYEIRSLADDAIRIAREV